MPEREEAMSNGSPGGTILWSVTKEIGKGALGAIGGEAMTGLFSLIGLGGDSSGEEIKEGLNRISGQLDELEHGISRLHEDLLTVEKDLERIDKDIVNEARKGRMQVVAQAMNRAELVIEANFRELMTIPKLGEHDRVAAMTTLRDKVLGDNQIEQGLDLLYSNVAGVEGTEGALQLLGQYYEADIDARKSTEPVYGYVAKAYEQKVVPYFSHRVGVQQKGVVLLMNAFAVDPNIKDQVSREVRINQARDVFLSNLRRQCDAFGAIARDFSLLNWPYEYFYYRDDCPRGVPYYEHYLDRTILSKADALIDSLLGGDGQAVVRIFVSHCSRAAATPWSSAEERTATLRVRDSIAKAIREHMLGAPWWNAKLAFPGPQVSDDLSDWPRLSPKLRVLILQETACLIEHRLPSVGIRPERADFLREYLDTIKTHVDRDIRLRDGELPLFSPRFATVKFRLNDHNLLAGSLNIPTYYEAPGKA